MDFGDLEGEPSSDDGGEDESISFCDGEVVEIEEGVAVAGVSFGDEVEA